MHTMRLSNLLCAVLLLALTACQATPQPLPVPTSAATLSPVPQRPTLPPTSLPVLTPTSKTEAIGQVVATIPYTDTFSEPVAGLGALWLPNSQSGQLTRLDTTTNKIVAEIKVGAPFSQSVGDPAAATIVDQQIWLTSDANHEVVRIDPLTNQIVEHIPLGAFSLSGTAWPIDPGSLTSDGTDLWVTDFSDSLVVRVDLKTKQAVAVIKNVSNPSGIVAADGAVWVILHRKDTLVRIDPATNSVVAKIPLGGPGLSPICSLCLGQMVFADGSLWIPLHDANAIARIDPQTNQMTKIDLGFSAADVAAGLDSIWVVGGPYVAYCKGFLVQIDPKTNAVRQKQSVDCPGTITVADNGLWVSTVNALIHIQPNP